MVCTSVADPFHFDMAPRILSWIGPKIETITTFFYTFFLLITQEMIGMLFYLEFFMLNVRFSYIFRRTVVLSERGSW